LSHCAAGSRIICRYAVKTIAQRVYFSAFLHILITLCLHPSAPSFMINVGVFVCFTACYGYNRNGAKGRVTAKRKGGKLPL
jgi:hypothetical protein